MDDDLDRTLMLACLAVTLVCIAVVTFWIVTAANAEPSDCVLFQGTPSELLGTPSLSWFPPGLTCTYQDGAFIDSPRYVRLPVLLVAIIGLPFTWWLKRNLRRGPTEFTTA